MAAPRCPACPSSSRASYAGTTPAAARRRRRGRGRRLQPRRTPARRRRRHRSALPESSGRRSPAAAPRCTSTAASAVARRSACPRARRPRGLRRGVRRCGALAAGGADGVRTVLDGLTDERRPRHEMLRVRRDLTQSSETAPILAERSDGSPKRSEMETTTHGYQLQLLSGGFPRGRPRHHKPSAQRARQNAGVDAGPSRRSVRPRVAASPRSGRCAGTTPSCTPDRRKTWVACDAHRAHLSDFLSARGFLRDVEPLVAEPPDPARTPPDPPRTPPDPPRTPPTRPETDQIRPARHRTRPGRHRTRHRMPPDPTRMPPEATSPDGNRPPREPPTPPTPPATAPVGNRLPPWHSSLDCGPAWTWP